jgi:prophage maintenance system killer protein/predicted regulator of amino acid metabolism with ACT domain
MNVQGECVISDYEIVKFIDNEFEIDVRTDRENDTVWLSQEQIAKLFGKARSTITEHINNIFKDKELDENTSVGFSDESTNHRPSKYYNLDVILSVGYRVNSKRGIAFRRWANKILKEYLIQGYSINEKKINYLNKTIEIQNKILASSLNIDEVSLVNVVNEYTKALDLLDDYDHQCVSKPNGRKTIYKLEYNECRKIIDSMKFSDTSQVFGVEKEQGKLNGIFAAIYQDVFGQEVYPSLEEKAAHLLYFLVKDHPFVDGCKRIAATLFLEFLNRNNALVKSGKMIISNDTLVAITVLTAESKPEEMEVVIKLIMNFLIGEK